MNNQSRRSYSSQLHRLLSVFLALTLVAVLFAAHSVVTAEGGVTFYVSPGGSDSNDGSYAAPFKTLDKARGAVAAYKTANGLPDGGITVYLLEGTYCLSGTQKFTSADSGANGKEITYKAYNGADVVIEGNRIIDSSYITKIDSSDKWWSLLDETVRNNVYKIDLLDAADTLGNKIFTTTWDSANTMLFQDSKPYFWMYMDGQQMNLARYPDLPLGESEYDMSYWKQISANQSANSFTVDIESARLEKWAQSPEVYVHAFFNNDNEDKTRGISAISGSKITIRNNETPKAEQPYCVLNAISELTLPGEFFFEGGTAHTVYFIPEQSIAATRLSVTPVGWDYTLQFKSAAYLNFEDITFDGGKTSIVHMEQESTSLGECHDISFTDCTFKNGKVDGVHAFGSNLTLDSCEIDSIGYVGIQLDGGDRISLTNSGNVIRNCDIHDYAKIRFCGNAGVSMVSATSCGHTVINNEIHDAPHFGIYFGGNENNISYNEIYNVCLFSSDSGAIYAARNWGFRGNRINYNYIHDIIPRLPQKKGAGRAPGAVSIYLDDCFSSAEVFGNIMVNGTSAGILLAGGRDNKVENNVIINHWRGLWTNKVGAGDQPCGRAGHSWNLIEKLNAVNYQSTVWTAAYPECAAIPNTFSALYESGNRSKPLHWCYPEGNTFSNNIGQGGWIYGDSADKRETNSWWMIDSDYLTPENTGNKTFSYYEEIAGNNSSVSAETLSMQNGKPVIDYTSSELPEGFSEIPLDLIGRHSIGTPAVSKAAGIYYSAIQVAFTDVPENALVYYTTDGTEPAASTGTLWNGNEISITASCVLKAILVSGGESGPVAAYQYTILSGIPTPTPSVQSGNYSAPLSVVFTNEYGSNTAVYYTTDGSDPSASNGTLWNGEAIVLSDVGSVTLSAVAVSGNLISGISRTSYTLTASPVAAPTVDKASGTYTQNVSLTVSCADSDNCVIYYTLDGTSPDPDQNSNAAALTGTTITLSDAGTVVLKLIAVRTGDNQKSNVVTYNYTIEEITVTELSAPGLSGGKQKNYILPEISNYSSYPAGTVFRYTTDGSTPTAQSTAWDGVSPLYIDRDTAFKCIAVYGSIVSPVTSVSYQIDGLSDPTVLAPYSTVGDSSVRYEGPIRIQIDTSVYSPDTVIYYNTTSSIDPNNGKSTRYNSGDWIELPNNGSNDYTIYCQAFVMDGTTTKEKSSSKALKFFFNWTSVSAPSATVDSGSYSQPIQVRFSNAYGYTTTVYYTTDGSQPSAANGTAWNGEDIVISSSCTLKAIAVAFPNNNTVSSTVSEYSYTVTAGSNANAIEGDLTSDGRVNSADLILMRQILLGTHEPSTDVRTAADLNKNGTIDIVDLVIMKKLSAR